MRITAHFGGRRIMPPCPKPGLTLDAFLAAHPNGEEAIGRMMRKMIDDALPKKKPVIREKITEFLAANGVSTTGEITAGIGTSRNTTQVSLGRMRKAGLVVRRQESCAKLHRESLWALVGLG